MTDASGDPGHVVLVGMMGAGKTTTGRALAARLGWPLVDSDLEVEQRTGGTGAALAARDGVGALHALEGRVLLDALARPEPAVITAAASVVESPACRVALQAARMVIWLDVSAGQLRDRMASGTHRRPLTSAEVDAVLERRRPGFAEVADLRVDARLPTQRIVEAVLARLSC